MRGSAIMLVAVLMVCGAGTPASAVTIDQSGQQFSEKSVSLKPGDAVSFANKDDVSHNITVVSDDDETTDLGLQKPGQTLNYKFDRAGRFKVRCSIHPSMKMTVTVK
jgi:plastocyanin